MSSRALAKHPAKRTVLFVFYTGEELNLKGSRWIVDHLPVPAAQVLININLEQVGSKNRSFPGIRAVSTPGFENVFY
jgi:Zn-dependent M28 family amino/carboxypeptidase